MSDFSKLAAELESEMRRAADPNRSVAMAAYMKNLFPFLGVNAPGRREVQRDWVNSLPRLSHAQKKELILELWKAPFRELHYAALDYLNKIPTKEIEKSDFELIQHLITTNSWWDSVDTVAAGFTGKYFKKFPDQRSIIEKWRDSDNLWLNRTCLIFQLKYGKDTDFGLLRSLILQYQTRKEFFIQKAIGWSLRQYSKFDPESVRNLLKEINPGRVALKEATKYL